MEKRAYRQLITDIVLRHIETLGKSDRERAKIAGIAHTAIGKMRSGTGMTLTTLEKIVNKFPELKFPIQGVFAEYVSGNTEENITDEGKATGLQEKIMGLQDTVRQFEERLSEYRQKIKDLEVDKNDLKADKADLKAQNTDLKRQIDDMREELKKKAGVAG